MSDHIYKTVEVIGSSTAGVDDAIKGAIDKASETLRHLDWFEVQQIRGHIEENSVTHVQVVMKLGFRLE